MLNKKLILIFITLLVASCATNNITPYTKLDKSEKSITVPAGGGANADLKTALNRDFPLAQIPNGSH